jgi:site-specific recombinase XerC
MHRESPATRAAFRQVQPSQREGQLDDGADYQSAYQSVRSTSHMQAHLRPLPALRAGKSRQPTVDPRFGTTPLVRITNAAVRSWVAEMRAAGLSPSTIRKAVFALRQCLDAAIADNRLAINPAISVPLPSEPLKSPRFLSQSEVEQLVGAMPDKYKAMVLVGAYAGLRWGEAAGLTRASIRRPAIPHHSRQHSG